jgi:transcriptional regulator with XRE-family HTH domain
MNEIKLIHIFGQLMSRNIYSMNKLDNIGSQIRILREESEMPLRKLAAMIDIDQSTLSKIERNERRVTIEIIDKISEIFQVNKRDLMICYYSDLIVNQIECENDYSEILQTAKSKILNANRKS